MKIAVMGAGSMGCAMGGRLAESGNVVWLVDRWQEQVDRINSHGLAMEGVGGERTVAVKATTDPRRAGIADLVMVFVKSMDTAAAARAALPMIGPGSMVLTLQNGLGNLEAIASVVGEGRVLSGVSMDSATLLGPGRVRHSVTSINYLGEVDGSVTERVKRVVALFRGAGMDARVTWNLPGEVWGKVLVNAVLNPTCAVLGCSMGELVDIDSARQWMRLLGDEVAEVARAVGITLPWPDPNEEVLARASAAGPAKPSMLQDVERGRPTEIDYINGAVVLAGQRAGVPTPCNQAITLLVRTIEARQRSAASGAFAG